MGQITLSGLFTDHMVLQRNKEIPVWGNAPKGEEIVIQFQGSTFKGKADEQGKWHIILPSYPEGGPYNMQINEIILNDIMVGDVWLCSGQSNMEWPMSQINDSEKEILDSNYPNIRLFKVAHKVALTPQENIDADGWVLADPTTVKDFSAVGFLFGRELHQWMEQGVPIGLIQSTWGGTEVETWISKEAIQEVDAFKEELTDLNQGTMASIIAKKKKEFQQLLTQFDDGTKEWENGSYQWIKPNLSTNTWKEMNLPSLWEEEGLKEVDGVVWFRKSIILTEEQANRTYTLSLAKIDDRDSTWVNGQWVGATNQYNEDRIYQISSDILVEGKNVIAIKVTDTGGGGGIYGDEETLYLESDEDERISLAGTWNYRVSPSAINYFSGPFGPNERVTLLYNGMIHGLIPYALTGAIWYQGESNASRAHQYQTLFPLLIENWRSLWGEDFSFLFVQLANFKEVKEKPGESDWAELREAQTMTLHLDNTAMASAIDIGEADDIHPRNKQDVAHRLVLGAKKMAYREELVYSGPMYKEMSVERGKAIISFSQIGGGLVLKEGEHFPQGFAIAGEDGKFYWADAQLENDKIILSSEKVPNPVAVRYAWADNPSTANVYNKEGLPAIPFRTDTWEGVTYNKK